MKIKMEKTKEEVEMDIDNTEVVDNNMDNASDDNDSELSSSAGGSQSSVTNKRSRGRGKYHKKQIQRSLFKCVNSLKEDHGKPLFGVSFNQFMGENEPQMFATVGSNRATIYECCENGYIKLLQAYEDPDQDETFYTCAWSLDTTTGHPILAFTGSRGVIRVFNIITKQCAKHYHGHGDAVNELKFHPTKLNLLLSASKDHSLRLWNIKTDTLVCVFGGVDGHRDEVLSCDFDITGTKLVSCGMDHSLKIWRLDQPIIQLAIEGSEKYDAAKIDKPFPTIHIHYPYFTTRDIHRNYVDCVKWYGDFLLSKSCENHLVCWKPGFVESDIDTLKLMEKTNVTILSRLQYQHCEIWYMRFAMDLRQRFLALGNQYGKTFVWDLERMDTSKPKCISLVNVRCTNSIRQTAFSKEGNILICVCDDATIWRWDLQGR